MDLPQGETETKGFQHFALTDDRQLKVYLAGAIATLNLDLDMEASDLAAAILVSLTNLPITNDVTAALIDAALKGSDQPVSNAALTELEAAINANSQIDANLATLISGEDETNGLIRVEPQYDYANIVLAAPTTTVVKASAGVLHAIVINKAAADGVITIYDNTAGSGTKIGTITMPAVLTADQMVLPYDVAFDTGLTLVTSGAAQDITVSFR